MFWFDVFGGRFADLGRWFQHSLSQVRGCFKKRSLIPGRWFKWLMQPICRLHLLTFFPHVHNSDASVLVNFTKPSMIWNLISSYIVFLWFSMCFLRPCRQPPWVRPPTDAAEHRPRPVSQWASPRAKHCLGAVNVKTEIETENNAFINYILFIYHLYIKNPQLQRRPTSHFATLSNTFHTLLLDLESRNMSKPRDRRSEDQHGRWRLSSLFLAISLAAAAVNPRRKSLPRLAKTQDMLHLLRVGISLSHGKCLTASDLQTDLQWSKVL